MNTQQKQEVISQMLREISEPSQDIFQQLAANLTRLINNGNLNSFTVLTLTRDVQKAKGGNFAPLHTPI